MAGPELPRWRTLRWVRIGAAWGLALLAQPESLQAQRVTTVRETEFRSRWANYQVDRPREEVAPELRPTARAAQTGTSLRSFFRNGPVVVRAALIGGWEYSDEQRRTTVEQETSKSSLFAAPVVALLYERQVGAWSASARYSAGYLYYLDQNFSTGGNASSGLSQTAGFDLSRKGTRLAVRSTTVGSSGSGYEIERGQQTERLTLGETLSADYQMSEYLRIGAVGSADYQRYSGDTEEAEDAYTRFSGRLFGDYFWTGKTGFHGEVSAGGESQNSGSETGLERSYQQALLGVKYQPTGKLTFRAGLGVGILTETGSTASTAEDGLRTIYSLDVDYAPTEKVSARLHFGLEGTSVEPEFSLALNWHPREATFVHLSIYQITGLSTISFNQDQTRRGVLGSVRQRFFQRLDANLSAGLEQQEVRNAGGEASAQSSEPYSYISGTLAWEINQWLAWQVQYARTSGRDSSFGAEDRPQTRASTSIRLTF